MLCCLTVWYRSFRITLMTFGTKTSPINNCSKNVSDKYFFQIFFYKSFSQLLFFPKILNIVCSFWFLIFLLAIEWSVRWIFEKNDRKWLIFNIKSDRKQRIFCRLSDPWTCQTLVIKLIFMHYSFFCSFSFSKKLTFVPLRTFLSP